MADDATDVQVADISPDDFMADEQESPKAESSPVEEKTPEKAEGEPEAEEKPAEADEPTDADTDSGDKPAEEPAEEKPQGKAEERKAQLNSEIRDLVAQRNAIKAEVEKANAEVYQPATEEELVNEGMNATEAKVESLRQQMELRDYNERVADAQLTLSSESMKVLDEFPMFNADSPEYEKELADAAAELLQANLIYDPDSKQVIGSNISPYKLYKTIATAAGISATKGQLKGQQAAEQMLASADTGSSAAPPKQKADPVAELWSEPL